MLFFKKNYTVLIRSLSFLALIFISFPLFSLFDESGAKHILIRLISLGLIIAAEVMILLITLGNKLNNNTIIIPGILLFSGLIFGACFTSNYNGFSEKYSVSFINNFQSIPSIFIYISGLILFLLSMGNDKLRIFNNVIMVAIILLHLVYVFSGSIYSLSILLVFLIIISNNLYTKDEPEITEKNL